MRDARGANLDKLRVLGAVGDVRGSTRKGAEGADAPLQHRGDLCPVEQGFCLADFVRIADALLGLGRALQAALCWPRM